jgi:triphosphoribosyl-dephospho-CoA synthase
LEVAAPKPGNVHRGADFDDAHLEDFLVSAVAIGPPMEQARIAGVGQAVLSAVQASRAVVATNTHLGTILLLAPLAAAAPDRPVRQGVADVLRSLQPADAHRVYQAIRHAAPGGLGEARKYDVRGTPPDDLLEPMRQASTRDRVAAQYVNDFSDVLDFICPAIRSALAGGMSLPLAIVHGHLQTMARYPDSLIERKCGKAVARQSADMAAKVLAAGDPSSRRYQAGLAELDFWLRADGHRRNPGTSADLVTAALFVLLAEEA